MKLLNYRLWVSVMSAAASVYVVPAALLLAFGDRPDQPTADEAMSLVSSVPPCVMFCVAMEIQSAPLTGAPTTAVAAVPSQGCVMLCDAPAVPPTAATGCQMFCELEQGWQR